MPDAFEVAYPLSPSLTPQEIRARANSSSSKRKPVVAFLAGDETVEIPDKSIAGVDKPLSRSELELDCYAETITMMHNTWLDRRQLEHSLDRSKRTELYESAVWWRCGRGGSCGRRGRTNLDSDMNGVSVRGFFAA
ncbi:unnamed protein product [Leptosia nina]|uniref:Uncharacterized protein n=1 Tax=Leptosia nina TaxID=320188 RepID=A0AAV1K148_9NEOP